MEKRNLRSATVRGRRVLVRVDFNVPLTEQGQVADDMRIAEAVPTLQHLQASMARTILLSHLGRPEGKRDMRFSLRPVVRRLSELLGQPVPLAPDCVGVAAINAVSGLKNGEFVMLENLRFHPGEEANDPAFVAQLSQLGESFVEEAFGVLHRSHASTVGLPKRLPSCVGFLVEREVRELSRLRDRVERPYMALLGGSKVSDKLPLLTSFLGRADTLIIGGALAFPFLRARGATLGASPAEEGLDGVVAEFFETAKAAGTELLLPEDVVVLAPNASEPVAVPVAQVPAGAMVFDIGPSTRQRFAAALGRSRTVFWNGPLGKAEDPRFAEGTRSVLSALGSIGGYHVSAGGDSARIAQELGVSGAFQYASTGGGAALEFVEGHELPGLAAIPDA
ncbi:MAG: phosphoglycerate kinase [Thermoplasmata archaeon]|nr:phosphoglycerate kinase [Thermoplasmata archaeon]